MLGFCLIDPARRFHWDTVETPPETSGVKASGRCPTGISPGLRPFSWWMGKSRCGESLASAVERFGWNTLTQTNPQLLAAEKAAGEII